MCASVCVAVVSRGAGYRAEGVGCDRHRTEEASAEMASQIVHLRKWLDLHTSCTEATGCGLLPEGGDLGPAASFGLRRDPRGLCCGASAQKGVWAAGLCPPPT